MTQILPRIVPGASAGFRSAGADLPRRALGFTGLAVIYQLHGGGGAKLIDRAEAERLGLCDAELHAAALANLRESFDAAPLSEPIRGDGAAILDGCNPACLLLIPELLHDGEALTAFIAGPDALVVAPAPNDGDWSALKSIRAAKKSAYGPPVKITRQGIEPLPITGGNPL